MVVPRAIGKDLAKARDFAAIDQQLSSRRKMIRGKIRNAVSKAIDMNYGRFDHAPVDSLRFQRLKLDQVVDHGTEFVGRDSTGQRRRCGCKDVAPVESIAHRMAEKLFVG